MPHAQPNDSAGHRQVPSLLGRLRLFAGLEDEQLRAVAQICHARRVEAGSIVFAEGAASGRMYIVLSGEIDIHSQRNGHLCVIRAGENFGEIGMLSQRPRTASATVLESGALLSISHDDFNRMLVQNPLLCARVLQNITEHLASHLIRMNDRLALEHLNGVDEKA